MEENGILKVCKIIYERLKWIKIIEIGGIKIYEGIAEWNYSVKQKSYKRKDKVKFRRDLKEYNLLNTRSSFNIKGGGIIKKCLSDWRGSHTCSSYFWMDLWGASRIIQNKPKEHFDIGSRLDGFIAHLLVNGVPVTMLDIRPLRDHVPGLKFRQTDATTLDNIENESIESLSAICSLEHFGLGRYGDPIDPEACFKAFKAIQRVMKPNGYVYIAVPVGKEHVEYNAHRVYYASTIVDAFNEMKLVEYSLITLGGGNPAITTHEDIHVLDNSNINAYKMGLFIFKK